MNTTFKTTIFVKILGQILPAVDGFAATEEASIDQAMENFLEKFKIEDMITIETKQFG